MSRFTLLTDYPLAVDSLDHIEPEGAVQDNSVNPAFNGKLNRLLNRTFRLLDLGCSGGGFVRACLSEGHLAVGLEGSDYSLKQNRAEWPVIPDSLFTCDISRPFKLREDGAPAKFDVVTAWEVLEHIAEERLTVLCHNVFEHLADDGLWLMSVSMLPYKLHMTVRPQAWWSALFLDNGFEPQPELLRYFGDDWVRGPYQNGLGSFNLVLSRKGAKVNFPTANLDSVQPLPPSVEAQETVVKTPLGNELVVSFMEAPKVEVRGEAKAGYRVRFTDQSVNQIVYETTIKPGQWAMTSLKFRAPWLVEVWENDAQCATFEPEKLDGSRLVIIDSNGLGDTLAWIPYAQRLAETTGKKVLVQTAWNHILDRAYTDLEFVDRTERRRCISAWKVGVFDNDYARNRNNWKDVPLQQVASDLLGLAREEIRPRVVRSEEGPPIDQRYVAISEHSTVQGKLWLCKDGWAGIVRRLKKAGFEVASISKEPTALDGVLKWNGRSIEETIRNIQHAAFFIGVSSGPAWLAWALGVPVAVISGMTLPFVEMADCVRVCNKTVCHGCFNDVDIRFDRANWRWCPRGRNFICSTSITPDMVWTNLAPLVRPRRRFSLLMPVKDRPEPLRRAVAAIQAQDFEDWELLVIDGGKSIKDLLPGDSRIYYEHRPNDGGLIACSNRALSLAQGEIVNFQADDDVMQPGALRRVHEQIGEAQWFFGRIRNVGNDTGTQGGVWNPERHLEANTVPWPATFFTKRAVGIIGLLDDYICPDYDYTFRLAARWEPKVSQDVLVDYTVHPGQGIWMRNAEMNRDRVAIAERAKAGHYAVARRRIQTKPAARTLFLLPHCSTGGMPQYVLSLTRELIGAGTEVALLEWAYFGPDFVVQRKQLQAALNSGFHAVEASPEKFFALLEKFQPDVVHLQEAPELFLPEAVAARLYTKPRSYRLVETVHNSEFGPLQVEHWPDAFVCVSEFHARIFKDECARRGVPLEIARYRAPLRIRPDRSAALAKLKLDPALRHVLNVGLFTPNKNQAEIWRTARRLPQINFHCVGNQAPNFRDYWQPLMADKPANVVVWGERDDTDLFYSSMDLLYFPSLVECFPLVVVEALSWQMPVLLRNLDAYGGLYDWEPLVTYLSSDPAAQILERLPAVSDNVLKLYSSLAPA
jgi:autotransporter strand-loop-strand O-heptosyltransferase